MVVVPSKASGKWLVLGLWREFVKRAQISDLAVIEIQAV